MTYEIKEDKKTFKIDDTIFFDQQSKDFRDSFLNIEINNIAEYDNCSVYVLNTRKVIIIDKEVHDE